MFIKYFYLQEQLISYYIISIFFKIILLLLLHINTYNLIYIIFHNDFCPENS
jgi:hypothetical protein